MTKNIVCLQCLKPVDKIEAIAPIQDLSVPYWVFCHGKKSFVQLSVLVFAGDWKVGVFPHATAGVPAETKDEDFDGGK